jgi:uncharacterized membrane protein YfcA
MVLELARVEISPWLWPVVAFAIACLTSMGGISGAFLILPFQVSVLGFTGPAASATNQLYNIIAIPGGVYRFLRERRLLLPLAWTIVAGSVPGVVLGTVIRVEYLPDPSRFKVFAGIVLLLVALRLVMDVWRGRLSARGAPHEVDSPPPEGAITVTEWNLRRIAYQFAGDSFQVNAAPMMLLGFVVGIIGGIYGIGGGAIIAPACVMFFRLPVHSIAGAALLATFVTSAVGAATFQVIDLCPYYTAVAPNWRLGLLLGLGGFVGTYCGVRLQKRVPAVVIGWILAVCIAFIAVVYVLSPWI